MKELGRMAISQVKKVYQLNEQSYQKIAKLEEKKAKIDSELEVLKNDVAASEERIKHITGGYTSNELVHPVVTPVYNTDGTPKLDKTGHQVKYKKYVFEYPTEVEGATDATPESADPQDATPQDFNPEVLNEQSSQPSL